jgi:hypothetical protein
MAAYYGSNITNTTTTSTTTATALIMETIILFEWLVLILTLMRLFCYADDGMSSV